MTLLLLLLSAASGSELDTPFSTILQARADVLFDAARVGASCSPRQRKAHHHPKKRDLPAEHVAALSWVSPSVCASILAWEGKRQRGGEEAPGAPDHVEQLQLAAYTTDAAQRTEWLQPDLGDGRSRREATATSRMLEPKVKPPFKLHLPVFPIAVDVHLGRQATAGERYNLAILARALVAGTHRGLRTVDRTSGLPDATLVLTFDDQGDRNALSCVPEGARVRAASDGPLTPDIERLSRILAQGTCATPDGAWVVEIPLHGAWPGAMVELPFGGLLEVTR
jgi:hypothetical protein